MITYLPEIYPDELVYSWFCRYYVHSGCLTHKIALDDILYNRHNNLSKEFIGHLSPEMNDKIQAIYPIEKLILEHTMFPQYARFVPLNQKKNALYHLAYDFCDAHHLFSILPRTDTDQYLKFCPICAEEDRQKYGETYWHRVHQIRNMQICYNHKCALLSSNITAKSVQTFTFCPAEDYVKIRDAEAISNHTSKRYAEYMAATFNTKIDFERDIPISAILYHAMANTQYMKSSGRTRYTKRLADDIQAFYMDIGIRDIASIYQIQRVLLGDRFDFLVVCQIAFYLGMSVKELIEPTMTDEQIQAEKDSHYVKDRIPLNWAEYDNELAPILEQLARDIYDGSASENGRPERVSERLVYRELDLSAHRIENMPKCRAVFERYRESYPESWARKIIWAYHKLQSERKDKPIYWSDIRALSGVKKVNSIETIPYLSKLADPITVKSIKKLLK